MTPRLILAGVVLLLAVLNFAYNLSEGRPLVPVAALGFAVIIWLFGVCCRYLLDVDEDRHAPARHT